MQGKLGSQAGGQRKKDWQACMQAAETVCRVGKLVWKDRQASEHIVQGPQAGRKRHARM